MYTNVCMSFFRSLCACVRARMWMCFVVATVVFVHDAAAKDVCAGVLGLTMTSYTDLHTVNYICTYTWKRSGTNQYSTVFYHIYRTHNVVSERVSE